MADQYSDQDEIAQARREGLGSGIVIVTTLLLIAAIFFMQKALGDHYGKGMFSDGKPPAVGS